MPRQSIGAELTKSISKLRHDRAQLVAKLAEIDDLCDKLGISRELISTPPARTRATRAVKPEKAPATGRRKRGTFSKTGEQSVLDIVAASGPMSAAQVNKKWKSEGRGGKADNTLGRLVNDGRLKRLEAQPGERGGKYILP